MVSHKKKAQISFICCLCVLSFYFIFIHGDMSVCVCEKDLKIKSHRIVEHKSMDPKCDQGTDRPISSLKSAEVDLRNYSEILRLSSTKPSTVFILLVTYGRSGSSWLGNITGQAENTFYVFEPFQRIVRQGYFKENSVCFNNNTCRPPRDIVERHTAILTAIYQQFTCQSSKLLPDFQQVFTENLRSRVHKEALTACLRMRMSSDKTCLQKIDDLCSLTSHRVLKTIRISMELVRIMMKLWQNLKVIHLVRDPRAITHSRLKLNAFNLTRNVFPHSQDLCNRMYMDSLISLQLQKLYPNRLRIVFYEALAEKPFSGAKHIYKFLNMVFSEKVFLSLNHSISTNASANETKMPEYEYHTVRYNSTAVASKWRTNMTLLHTQIIDYFCKDLYTVLGFIAFNSSTELRSVSVLSRKHIDIDGFN